MTEPGKRPEPHHRVILVEASEVAGRLVPVLREAIEGMLAREERSRPFVILEDVGSGSFVQWCGSKTRPLRFEMPVVGMVVDPDEPRDAAERGIGYLASILHADFSRGARVIESDTFEGTREEESRMRQQRDGESLYEWADDAMRSDVAPEAAKIAACAAVVHNVGVLVGLGASIDDVADFVRRVVEGTSRLHSMIDPTQSIGENVDALSEALASGGGSDFGPSSALGGEFGGGFGSGGKGIA